MKQTFIFLTVFLCLGATGLYSQVAKCKPNYTISTPPFGCEHQLYFFEIDNGSSDYDTAYFNTNVLAQIDSTYDIILTVAKFNGTQSQCTTRITYKDKSAPVPLARQNIYASMDANGETITLTPALVDGGSYDNCNGALQFEIIPSVLDCSAENPSFVILRVIDESNNYNETWAKINLPFDKNSTLMKCRDTTRITIKIDEEREVTPDMILEGGPYKCFNNYEVKIKDHGSPILTHIDELSVQEATIMDKSTFKSCKGNIKVTIIDCTPIFFACDFKSRCEPEGDCTSGHTLADFVEWPCDLDISVPISVYNSPQSEVIANYLNVPYDEIGPKIKTDSCAFIGVNTQDNEEIIAGGKIIRRTWQLIDWRTQKQSPKYTQTIKLKKIGGECKICDTKPWNTPFGDCDSGHTSTDHVEWPSDINLKNDRIGIYDLTNNASIVYNDRTPVIDENCDEFLFNYADQISLINPAKYKIKREWIVYNFIDEYHYVQNIEVDSLPSERKVCTLDPSGNPILNVQLQGNLYIDDIECTTFDFNPALPLVTPYKKTSFLDGINIHDQVLLTEYLLKIKKTNAAQFHAADLDQNFQLNTEDVLLLSQLMNGDTSSFLHLTTPWSFYLNKVGNNNNLLQTFADVTSPLYTYQFTGVKLGDLDNSSNNSNVSNIEFLYEDQVLTNGQSYDIPIKTTFDHKIKGMQFSLLKSDKYALNSISSLLPNIEVNETESAYFFTWIANTDQMKSGGLQFPKDSEIITLKIKSNFNQVLNNAIAFGDDRHNRLSTGDAIPVYKIHFKGNNVIPNSTIFELDTKYKIYPNPTMDDARIVLPNNTEKVIIELLDTNTKICLSQIYGHSDKIDLSSMSSGLYIVKITEQNGNNYIGKLVKY